MNLSDYKPPSGAALSWSKNSMKISLHFNTLVRLAIVLFWLVFSVFAGILLFRPGTFGFRAGDIDWSILGPIWAGGSLLALNFLLVRTEIRASKQYLAVIHIPWRFPLTTKIPTQDVSRATIETIASKMGAIGPHHNQTPSTMYRFNVRLEMNDCGSPFTIFSTQDQAQAVFICEMLNAFLEEY